MKKFGIVELYCGNSGKRGFYNNQEIGLSKAMKKKGYLCYIFYPDKESNEFIEEVVEDDITIVRCPAKSIGVHAKYDWKVLKKYEIDFAQIGSDNQLFAPDVIRYCDENSIRVYSYIGTISTDSKNSIKKAVMKKLFKRNVFEYQKHMNYVKTETVKKQLNDYGVQNVELAYVGLDIDIIPQINDEKNEIKNKMNLPVEKKILLFVGRVDKYKHPERFIELLSRLSDDFYGIIIGDGDYSKKIQKMINDKCLTKKIKWIRKIPNNEIHKYYYCAHCFLNFNEKEIFGMSVLEAMYQGCSVVAFHAPGPDTIIENGISGYLVNDLEEMEKCINLCDSLNPEKIKNRVVNSFLWDKTADKINLWLAGN